MFAQWDELIGDFKSSEGKSEYSTELLSTLENDLASVQKLMKKKKTMYENDVIDIDELIRETEKLREKEKELQREIKNIQQNNSRNNEDLKSIIRNIDSLWLHANDYERKQLMTMVFEQLVIDTKDEYHSTKHAREIIIVSAK